MTDVVTNRAGPAQAVKLFELTYRAILVNVDGIDAEQSLRRPEPAGNCVNWVLGHVLVSRDQLLDLLHGQRVWPEDAGTPYRRGASAELDRDRALGLPRLLSDLELSQERLLRTLRGTPEEAVLDDGDGARLSDRLLFYHFHEAYHAGQLALLRRLLGLPGAIG